MILSLSTIALLIKTQLFSLYITCSMQLKRHCVIEKIYIVYLLKNKQISWIIHKNTLKHFMVILKLFEFYNNLPEISNKRIIKYNFIHFAVFFEDWFILIFFWKQQRGTFSKLCWEEQTEISISGIDTWRKNILMLKINKLVVQCNNININIDF